MADKMAAVQGMAVSQLLYFISSAITYCMSPYASFYAGLSCQISCHRHTLENCKNLTNKSVKYPWLTQELNPGYFAPTVSFQANLLCRFCLQSLPLYLFVCVCVTFCVNVCFHLAEILKKNHLKGFEHFQSNGTLPFSYLTLTLIFKVNNFGVLLLLQTFHKW